MFASQNHKNKCVFLHPATDCTRPIAMGKSTFLFGAPCETTPEPFYFVFSDFSFWFPAVDCSRRRLSRSHTNHDCSILDLFLGVTAWSSRFADVFTCCTPCNEVVSFDDCTMWLGVSRVVLQQVVAPFSKPEVTHNSNRNLSSCFSFCALRLFGSHRATDLVSPSSHEVPL